MKQLEVKAFEITLLNASKLEVSIATVALSMATFTESVCEKPNAVKNNKNAMYFIYRATVNRLYCFITSYNTL
jgi:hypothetical protein